MSITTRTARSISEASFYDTSQLKSTLERFVDFDRINAGPMRVSVGAVNVRSVPVGAETAREALSLFSADPEAFDVAVIDLAMPDMDGRRLFDELRAIPIAAGDRVITGFAAHDGAKDGEAPLLLRFRLW